MKATFAELGIPFPLYDAPVEPSDESEYVGGGTCCICTASKPHCFSLGIGTALMVACPNCSAFNGLSVYDKENAKCRKCGTLIVFPSSVAAKKEPKTCYECLRGGKVALTKDTELGMISWTEAFSGVTGGVPGLHQNQFDEVSIDADDEWVGVKLPEEIMLELLRTPTYGTWQGECWLFCCRYPMTFVGEWQHDQFNEHAGDGDGSKLFYSVAEDVPAHTWEALGNVICVYVFSCKRCGKLRAH